MNEKLSKTYYSPQGYWKGIAAIIKFAKMMPKKWTDKPSPLANISSCSKNTFLAPTMCLRKTPGRPFLSSTRHCGRGRGRKTYKYALTVVDVASLFKDAEPLTSKDSAKVASAFQNINLQTQAFEMVRAFASVPGREFIGAVTKEMKNTKQHSQTRRLWKNLTATLLSACSATSIFRMVSSASCCDLRPERRSMKNLSPNQMNLYCFIYRTGPNGAFQVRSCWLYPLPLFCLQQIQNIIITLCGCQSVSICKCGNAISSFILPKFFLFGLL